jgi:hypothetical protein
VIPADQSREPTLDRAMPADVGPGPVFFENTDAEVLLRDGSWVWCHVIGQRKDRHGRWCVGIQYYPNATIGESGGWYLLDRSKIRRPGLGGRPAGVTLAQPLKP